MKATGIVRRTDDLGRIVIPKDIRGSMQIREGDPLEIFVENDMVCFKKYVQSEEERKEKIRKYVTQNYFDILSVFFDGDVTTVIFKNGRKTSVKKNKYDEFDLNAAIYYSMLQVGYKGIENF